MRSCIIETTVENRAIIEAHLPPGVKVAAVNKPFERPVVELRLEGDSLPPWAEHFGTNSYIRAYASVIIKANKVVMRLELTSGTLNDNYFIQTQIHPDVKE